MWRNWVPRQCPHLVPTMHNDIHSDYGERAQSTSALPDTRLLDRCWIVYLLAVCEPTSKGPSSVIIHTNRVSSEPALESKYADPAFQRQRRRRKNQSCRRYGAGVVASRLPHPGNERRSRS